MPLAGSSPVLPSMPLAAPRRYFRQCRWHDPRRYFCQCRWQPLAGTSVSAVGMILAGTSVDAVGMILAGTSVSAVGRIFAGTSGSAVGMILAGTSVDAVGRISPALPAVPLAGMTRECASEAQKWPYFLAVGLNDKFYISAHNRVRIEINGVYRGVYPVLKTLTKKQR